METLHPSILSAAVLLLGGAGLIASRDKTATSGRSTQFVALTTWTMAVAVLIFSLSVRGTADPGDDLLRSSSDPISMTVNLLLLTLALAYLVVPETADGRSSPQVSGFLLLSISAGMVGGATNSILLLVIFADMSLAALYLRQRSIGTCTWTGPRSLARFGMTHVLLWIAVAAIYFDVGSLRLDRIESLLQTRFEQLADTPNPDSVEAGLLCAIVVLVVAMGWRIASFPFAPIESAADEPLAADPVRFGDLLLSSLILLRILPALRGMEEASQMILCTVAVPTFLREVVQLGRAPRWRSFLDHSLTAAAALIWLGMCILLFDQQHGIDTADGFGAAVSLGELSSALLGWLMLSVLSRVSCQMGHDLRLREDFSGLSHSRPLFAFLAAFTLLSWQGIPGLSGYSSRIGLLSSLFRLASSGYQSAEGFGVISIVLLMGLSYWLAVALRWISPMLSAPSLRRDRDRIPFMAIIVLAWICAAMMWIGRAENGFFRTSDVVAIELGKFFLEYN